ncbi:MULE transposase domain [Arabidopsis thaliana x Arabidopsis arenosa]|uniref:MULE transposase domain n=1 Tax=Arabidopsis thaliana x Arabidopsis arenosa TaxID=1240361 RepID=A0A8T1YBQ3_9BRAS|nr:MULE transposase domain [Arabidopsis thaliana x Arabidopsis arenosa]
MGKLIKENAREDETEIRLVADVPVFVIAGSWECSDKVNARPPVVIASNIGVRNFLAVKETSVHLNLLLSLEPEDSDDVGVMLRKQCSVPAEKAKGVDDTAEAFAALMPIDPAIPDEQNSNATKVSGVRRRLFGGNEASSSKEPLRMHSVPENTDATWSQSSYRREPGFIEDGGTKESGIIRLADPDTPSLSSNYEENNETVAAGERTLASEEEEELVRAVEAAEKQENERIMRKGKGKCTDSGDAILSKHNEDSDSDGLLWSGTDDDELCDEDYWTLAFDRQYSFDFNSSLLQLGEPLTAEDPPNDGDGISGEEDIGAAVLSYVAKRTEDPAVSPEDNLVGHGNLPVSEDTFGEPDSLAIDGGNIIGNASPADTLGNDGGNSASVFSVGNHGGPSGLTFAVPNQSGSYEADFPVRNQGGVASSSFSIANQTRASEVHVSVGIQEEPHASAIPVANQADVYDDFTQGRDAEPVFDDIYQLTNTDGCAVVSAEEDAIYIGRVFKDKESLQNTLAIYAIKRLFHFRQTKSDTTRAIFVCVDRHCQWRVFAHRVSKYSENYAIRTATLTHSCSITARSQYEKQASAKVIAEVLKGKYANGLPGPRACDIPDIVLEELKVSVTYMKAWYAKEAAVIKCRGSDEKSYKLLAVYMYLLQKGNPGTVYKLEYTGGGLAAKQFKYLFFSLGASIAGIKFMRKVVLVDDTAIKTKFKGVLMTASMQDANFQVFPIAFGIVDAENDLAWTWFFKQLSSLIPDAEDLVLVSDRHRSIYAGVRNVYPQAFHGACAVHIERNVKVKSPGTGIEALVGKAARAFNSGDYKEWYAEIEKRSKKCAAYLDAIPLEHWTQAFCPAKRYNLMSSNIAEALNGALAKIVELPIVSMVESIRTKLMEWFCFRREKGRKLLAMGHVITPAVNILLLRHHTDSAGLAVKPVSDWSFQVASKTKQYYVDLAKKTCTCLQFQKLEVPCCHALAAARRKHVEVPSLVGEHYMVKVFAAAYEKLIFPVPNECDEEIPTAVQETEFIPPENKNGPGRRKKKRIPSTGEFPGAKRRKTGPHKCSTCGEQGHNRATCSNMPA